MVRRAAFFVLISIAALALALWPRDSCPPAPVRVSTAPDVRSEAFLLDALRKWRIVDLKRFWREAAGLSSAEIEEALLLEPADSGARFTRESVNLDAEPTPEHLIRFRHGMCTSTEAAVVFRSQGGGWVYAGHIRSDDGFERIQLVSSRQHELVSHDRGCHGTGVNQWFARFWTLGPRGFRNVLSWMDRGYVMGWTPRGDYNLSSKWEVVGDQFPKAVVFHLSFSIEKPYALLEEPGLESQSISDAQRAFIDGERRLVYRWDPNRLAFAFDPKINDPHTTGDMAATLWDTDFSLELVEPELLAWQSTAEPAGIRFLDKWLEGFDHESTKAVKSRLVAARRDQ